MQPICHYCHSTLTGRPGSAWTVGGVYRYRCADLQGCAERAVERRHGIPVAVQQAWFRAAERGLIQPLVA